MARPRILRLILAPLLALGLGACGCPRGMVDSADACRQVTDAFTGALDSCGLDSYWIDLCSTTCGARCVDETDVAACSLAIRSLGCQRLSSTAIKELDACVEVFEKIARGDCSDSDFDWDD